MSFPRSAAHPDPARYGSPPGRERRPPLETPQGTRSFRTAGFFRFPSRRPSGMESDSARPRLSSSPAAPRRGRSRLSSSLAPPDERRSPKQTGLRNPCTPCSPAASPRKPQRRLGRPLARPNLLPEMELLGLVKNSTQPTTTACALHRVPQLETSRDHALQ